MCTAFRFRILSTPKHQLASLKPWCPNEKEGQKEVIHDGRGGCMLKETFLSCQDFHQIGCGVFGARFWCATQNSKMSAVFSTFVGPMFHSAHF